MVADLDLGLSLAEVCRALYRRGWMEGTAGNVSARLDESRILITASGRSKGELTRDDVVPVDLWSGRAEPASSFRPSAETVIHIALYRTVPGCGAVVHSHPPYATALTVAAARAGTAEVRFTDFEILKGLGLPDPAEAVIPIFRNWADVPRIAADVAARYAEAPRPAPPALLIGFHGATAWGPDLETARNRLECLELLCQLQLMTATGRPRPAKDPEEDR